MAIRQLSRDSIVGKTSGFDRKYLTISSIRTAARNHFAMRTMRCPLKLMAAEAILMNRDKAFAAIAGNSGSSTRTDLCGTRVPGRPEKGLFHGAEEGVTQLWSADVNFFTQGLFITHYLVNHLRPFLNG